MMQSLVVHRPEMQDIEQYLHPFIAQQNSMRTRAEYRYELKMFAEWIRKPFHAVTVTDIIAYRQHQEARGLKPATIHKRLSVLRSFYAFASQLLGIPNPALAVRLPKIEDQSTKAVLSLQEVGRLLSVVDTRTVLGKRDIAILGLLLVNGLRTIEVSRANIGDMHDIDGIPVLKVHGKGGKVADTKLRKDVQDAIQAYLETRTDTEPDAPLFHAVGNLAGDRMSEKTVQARVRHYLRLAGISKPNLTAHSLRHTCAVLTLSLGKADLIQVQRLLRHSDPKVTMRYIQSLDWLHDNAVDRNPISI